MRADWPPWLGKRSFRTSAACWDSTPGTRKLSSNSPPALPCSAMTAMAATSQRPSTRNGWRALLRPRRNRNALTGILLDRAPPSAGTPAPSRKALILDRAGADARSSPRSGTPKRPTQAVKATSPPSSPRRPARTRRGRRPRRAAAVAVARARSRSSRWNAGTGASASRRRRSAWPSSRAARSGSSGLGGEDRRAPSSRPRRPPGRRSAGRCGSGTGEGSPPGGARGPRCPRRSPRRCGRGAGGGRPSRSGRGTDTGRLLEPAGDVERPLVRRFGADEVAVLEQRPSEAGERASP